MTHHTQKYAPGINQVAKESSDLKTLDFTDISSVMKFLPKRQIAEAFVVLRNRTHRLRRQLKLANAKIQALAAPAHMGHEHNSSADESANPTWACKLCGVTYHSAFQGVCAAKVLAKYQAHDFS